MAEVIPLRPFVNARAQAKAYGPNVAVAIVRRVRQELSEGGDGFGVARTLQRDRLQRGSDVPPTPPAAA